MRLFVALALPPEVASELDEVVAPLRPAWPDLRWTGVELWHLTLSFLGEVDEAVTGMLAASLEGAANSHRPIPLALAGAGAFPVVTRARVLWIGVQADLKRLTDLAGSVAGQSSEAGVPPSAGAPPAGRRSYQPHLTLARCRAPVDVSSLVNTLNGYQGTGWVASEIHLIHSRLDSGPRYEVIGSWPLNTGPGH
jgi:2'-5' RNA ligase